MILKITNMIEFDTLINYVLLQTYASMIVFSGTDVSRGTTYWKRTLPTTSVPSMLTMTKWKPAFPFSSRTSVTADIAVEFMTL